MRILRFSVNVNDFKYLQLKFVLLVSSSPAFLFDNKVLILDSAPAPCYTVSTMKVGDLVKTTGFGPEGTTGELGIIIKASTKFLRVVIVYFSNGVQTPYAVDGLVVVNENR